LFLLVVLRFVEEEREDTDREPETHSSNNHTAQCPPYALSENNPILYTVEYTTKSYVVEQFTVCLKEKSVLTRGVA
jgi:hypothetical protein